MKFLALLPVVFLVSAEDISIKVPAGSWVRVVTTNSPEFSPTQPPTNTLPGFPPMPPAVPLSVQMRRAAQEARNQAAPWTTRFSVVKVEEKAFNEVSKDAEGVPDGTSKYTTNFIVTLQAVPINETNLPVAWGAVKSGLLKMRLEFPVKVGDKLDFAPSSL